MIRKNLYNKKGDVHEFMGVNLITLVLFAIVLSIAGYALFKWQASFSKQDVPSRVDVSFDRLSTIMDKSFLKNSTYYTTLSLTKGSKLIYFPKFDPDKLNRKDCRDDYNCICIAIYDASKEGEFSIAKCKELNYDIDFQTKINVINNDKIDNTISINNCVSDNMYYCDKYKFLSDEKFLIKLASVSVLKENNLLKVEFIANVNS